MPQVTPSPYRAALFALAALLAGCSTTLGAATVGDAIGARDVANQRLFVGNSGSITIYSTAKANKLLGSITPPSSPYVAMSPDGRLYSSNSNGSITVYDGRTYKLLHTYTTLLHKPSLMVFDSSGNLYIKDGLYAVAYPNGSPIGSYQIHPKVKHGRCWWIAVASNGDLYMSTTLDVEVFKSGSAKPYKKITNGTSGSNFIALDTANDLYVSDFGSGPNCGELNIYLSGKHEPSYSIGGTKAQCDMGPMAEGPDGNMYIVAHESTDTYGVVEVYTTGKPTLLRTVGKNLYQPTALGFDASSNLYVTEREKNAVDIYAAGSSSLLRTITEGLSYPDSLTFSI
jgi:hypothetical protein